MDGSELVGTLRGLSELHEAGALTDDEYAGAKARVLGGGNGDAAPASQPSWLDDPLPTASRPASPAEVPPADLGPSPTTPLALQAPSPERAGRPLTVTVLAVAAVLALLLVMLLANQVASRSVASGRSTPSLAVPDAYPAGATDAIALSGGGTAERIQLDVAITHSYSTDVVVQLSAPNGRSATVFDRGQGYGQVISVVQDSANAGSPLQALLGEPVTGEWRLTVTDTAQADIGTLDSWTIRIER